MSTRYALIFGASGITGWSLIQEALRYPTPTTFDKVIGLTNRPMEKEEALLPDDERLCLYGGIDLSMGVDVVEAGLRSIQGIESVTHVYFAAYTGHGTGFEMIKESNVLILENAVLAIERLCPNLQFWTLQSGGKWYGFEFADKIGIPETPIKESTPRIPEPFASNIMYYAQFDLLERLSKDKGWSFVEVRPDVVSGFVPFNNAMNLAQSLAIFLSFYASQVPAGTHVTYPGPLYAYTARHSDISQSCLARFHIFASMHPDLTAGQGFNVGNEDAGTSWAEKWPLLAAEFGLVGDGPPADPTAPAFSIEKYMEKHRMEWTLWVTQKGLKKGVLEGTDFGFLTLIMSKAVFRREYDLAKARGIGWNERGVAVVGYLEAFSLMRKAGIISI